MRRIRWPLLAALAALLVLAVAGTVTAVLTFEPDRYRLRVQDQVRAATGLDIRVDGDISLSVLPWWGVAVEGIAVANPPGYGGGDWLTLQRAEVHTRLLPLLAGRIRIEALTLEGLVLELERDERQRGNWEPRPPSGESSPDTSSPPAFAGSTEPPPPGPQAASTGDASADPARLLDVGRIALRSARIRYRERGPGRVVQAEDLSLETGRIRPNHAFPLSVSTRLTASDPALAADLGLQAEMTLAEDLGGVRVTSSHLHLDPVEGMPSVLAAAVDLDLAGELRPDRALRLSTLRLSSGGLTADGGATLEPLAEDPRLQADIVLRSENLARSLERLSGGALSFSHPGTLGATEIPLVLEADAETASLQVSGGHVGTLDLDVEARLTDLTAPEGTVTLTLGTLDLDRMVPEPAGTAPPESAGQDETTDPPLPETARLAWGVDVEHLVAGGFHLQQLRTRGRVEGPVVHLDTLTASLYEGSLSGGGRLHLAGPHPELHGKGRLAALKLAPLLEDLAVDTPVTGTLTLDADLTLAGSDPEALRRSLTGTLTVSADEGTVDLSDPEDPEASARAEARGPRRGRFFRRLTGLVQELFRDLLRAARLERPRRIRYHHMGGTFHFRNGAGSNDDLLVETPNLELRGEGTFSLPQETLEYELRARVAGLPLFPVRVYGSFADPRIEPSPGRALERGLERLDDQAEATGRQLGRELKRSTQGLRDLLGGGR